MQVQVCFVEGGKGAWLDLEPGFRLPTTDYPDDVMRVVQQITLPDGMTGLRVLTSTEVWTFQVHPTYGVVPRLELDAGEVREAWPTNSDLGGQWVVQHVLPDGNLLPMCYVEPAPAFVMGDAEAQNRRKVNVPGGFMALTPTTVRQWNWYAAAMGKPPKSVMHTEKGGASVDLNDHPVTEVSYWDACEFAQWAGVGIPTEEQWEHAARGNDGRKFPWGNEPPTQETCHSSVQVQQSRPDSVFNRPKGASPYGCLDMSGNVWEWTSTVHK
jgi:hypothetical protein